MTDPVPPAATPSRPRRLWWVLAIVGAFIVGTVVGGVAGAVGGVTVAALGHGSAAKATPAAADSYSPTGTLDTSLPSDTPSAAFEYSADTFTIKLKTTSKECFGSAGCNVTVQPVLSTLDTSLISDSASGSLTYDITGGQDGTVTETIDLTGSQYTPQETTVQTPSSGTQLHVKITDVQTNP